MTIYVLFKTSTDTVSLNSRRIRYKFDDDLWQPVDKCSKKHDVAFAPQRFSYITRICRPKPLGDLVTNGGIHSTHRVAKRTKSCVCYTHNIASSPSVYTNIGFGLETKHLFVPNNKHHLHCYNHHQFSCCLTKMDNFIIIVKNGTVGKIKNYY
jgi:hypothetical protein